MLQKLQVHAVRVRKNRWQNMDLTTSDVLKPGAAENMVEYDVAFRDLQTMRMSPDWFKKEQEEVVWDGAARWIATSVPYIHKQ